MIINIALIFILSLGAELIAPWWSLAIVCFAVSAWRASSGWKALLEGFSGIGLLWLIIALFIHWNSGGILTARMSEMFQLPLTFLVFVITVIVGGITGGIGCVAGFHFGGLFKKKLPA